MADSDTCVWIPLGPYFTCHTGKSSGQVPTLQSHRVGDWEMGLIKRSGTSAMNLITVKGTETPSPEELTPGGYPLVQGYAALVVLSGGAVVNDEYVEGPGVVVSQPKCTHLPVLTPGTVAVLTVPGKHGEAGPHNRIFGALPLATGTTLTPARETTRLLKAAKQGPGISAEEDRAGVRWWLRSYRRDALRVPAHRHGDGGELLLVIAGTIGDRPHRLGAFDLSVNGPFTRHGPSVVEDAVCLTVAFGTEATA